MPHPPVVLASLAIPLVAAGAAAAAVAVPVFIHLLTRQRPQVVEWAAVRFLQATQKAARRRVDRWLVLLARMLLLAAIVAGMAADTPWAERLWQGIRPAAAVSAADAPRTHRVVVLDAGLSMSTRRPDGASRFEAAVQQVDRVLSTANPGDGFSLIVVGVGAEAVVPGPSADAAKVLAELRAVKPTHAAGDLLAGLTLAADTLAKSPRAYPRRQLLVVTDVRKSAWAGLLAKPDGGKPDLWGRILPRADVAVVDAAGGEADNLAVVDLQLADPLPLAGSPAAVTVTVQNFGRTTRTQVRLELLVGRAGGGDVPLLPVESRAVPELPAGQRASVTFALDAAGRFRDPGPHLVQVRLADGDDLPADDRRTLAVDVKGGLTAVLVNGHPAVVPLKRSAGYLLEALAPGGRASPGNPARPKLLNLGEFADPTLGDLSATDAVFLCDVPAITPAEVARLDAHLKRGGGVVIGLGPNAAAAAELYNRVLFADGTGLLPGKILGVAGSDAADAPGFRLVADEDSFRRPPLAAFADDNARAGLTSVPFRKYVKLDAPADGKGRRVLSFVPADTAGDARPDPAVVELPRHRGRVVVYTSTFNGDWTDWPVLPSYLPFAHELLRHVAAAPDPHTVRVGEPLEAMLPAATVGLNARLTGPDGITADAPVAADADGGAVQFRESRLAGLYRVGVPGRPDQTFAVNPPGGPESDLRRLDPDELKALGPIAVVTDAADAPAGDPGDGGPAALTPRPHGPTVARWLLSVAFALALLEGVLAWRAGPGRGRAVPASAATAWRPTGLLLAGVPLLLAVGLLAVFLHAELTGSLLGFLPDRLTDRLEVALGVPTAPTGEDVRWRLESRPAYRPSLLADRGVLALMAVGAVGLAVFLYSRERRAAGRWSRVILPLLLRTAAYAVLLAVLLPQVRLAFEREGFPDVAILLDTSESMATVDPSADAGGSSGGSRLKLAQQLLARGDGDLLGRLLAERRVRVHVYSLAEQLRLATEVGEAPDLGASRAAVTALAADGPGSRLGDGVQQVLKAFRGGSLAGVVVLSDGVVTAGDDLPSAGRAAARAGVPLYTVGFGDAREPTDLALTDFKADEVVLKGDELVVEARLTARGGRKPGDVPVTLYERQGEKLVKRGTVSVKPDPAGKPVPVRLTTTPTEVGEKTFVLDVPAEPGEAEAGNNRIERVVLVTESRKLKVLYVEGYPRYEFRFVKALLERETEADKPGRAVELSTLLLDASAGYADQDRSAVRGLPTRTELFAFDLVVLGDVDPAALPKPQQAFADLTEFVTTRGGGLMLVAGPQSNPGKFFTTPLADLLPVVPSEATTPPTEFAPYQPKLTSLGRSHPLFRFAPDEAENARVWAGLRPLNWFATGYRRKLSAEVLAVHPDRPAEGQPGEQHPLVLQQFAGSGRVLFVGFDDSWRWRFRADEERFNQYWRQAGRFLARSRPSRTELRTDKQTAYRRDEPIRLTVRFPDDAPAPPPDVAVKVVVERTGAAAETVGLAKVDGTRATYQTLLTRTPEGDYRFRLTEPTPPGTPPRAEAKVLPPAVERDRLDMDTAALTRAAAEGHGKFYRPGEADRLIDDLPEAARVPLNQPVPPLPVWNQAAMFGLVAGLFGAEWLLRRRERLV